LTDKFWGLPVISSSSHESDWDGDIIPHIVAASQTNKAFATLWYMKKEAYAESTIHAVGKRLEYLAKNVLLCEPEIVKGFVAQKDCSNAFKETLVEAYDLYCRANNVVWKKPFYERYDKMPKIPTEEKLNMIVARASKCFALILSMMKDLGTRPIELTWLKVKDVDLETGIVTITSAKHCIGRTLRLKAQTLIMLKAHVLKRRLSQNDRLFAIDSSSISEGYRRVRNRLAENLGDMSLKSIRLYDFRHFKASMEYHKTKDLLHVKRLLGHKDLRTTLRYTQLIEIEGDEFHSATAKTVEEAKALIEQGFDYVCDIDAVKLFRKRK
jgi:integrase